MATLVTHNGDFHTDDVFACAAIQLFLDQKGEPYTIVRTRDEAAIKKGTIVFDVGGIYNPEAGRFDHHQPGGAGERDNGVPYAAFGLVWDYWGIDLCRGNEDVAKKVDEILVQSVDALDVGMDVGPQDMVFSLFSITSAMSAFRPTWQEDQSKVNVAFDEAVHWAKRLLLRVIAQAQAGFAAKEQVQAAYVGAADKRVVILPGRLPALETLIQYPEPLFYVYPHTETGTWRAKAVRKKLDSFEVRKNFPKSWAGLRDLELAAVSGVQDAVFCHNALFLAVAKSQAGVLALVEQALLAGVETKKAVKAQDVVTG